MNRTISIKVIGDRIMQHPLMQDMSFEQIVSYMLDFIRIVGIPKTFEEKIVTLEVKDYRVLLPCDLIEIIQVKQHCSNYCMRASTNTFHTIDYEPTSHEMTFKVQGDILYTNFREGAIDIAYKSISVDEDGYPTVPEEPIFVRALETYIKKQWFTILFDLGKLQPAALQNVQQEYAFYVGQAQNSMIVPTLSEMESISNMVTKLLRNTNEFRAGFRDTGAKELLKIH